MGKVQQPTTATTEVLIHIMEQQLAFAKQSEDQRTTITNILVLIAVAIQGVLTQTGLTQKALPLTCTLIILGFFGMVATTKLYERFRYHYEVMRQVRKKLEIFHPDTAIEACLNAAWQEHSTKHPVVSRRIRLYVVWSTLHALIMILGIIYTFSIFFK